MPGLHDQKSAVGSRRQYVGRCGAALSSFGFPRLIRKSPRIRSASGSSRQILQIAIEQAMIGNRVGWLLLEEVPNSSSRQERGKGTPRPRGPGEAALSSPLSWAAVLQCGCRVRRSRPIRKGSKAAMAACHARQATRRFHGNTTSRGKLFVAYEVPQGPLLTLTA